MENLIENLLSFWGNLMITVIIVLLFFINKWAFNKFKQKNEKGTVLRQTINVIIILLGALAFTIALPIEKSLKEQIISLIGIVLSAAFALSSTTLIGNALAGLMNSTIKNYTLGNFIKIENNFGRITKKGLFRTEIQTEDRNLVSLPNLYIAQNTVKAMRDSGTIISTRVSLGYDLSHTRIEELLIKAAKEAKLEEPFVYIKELGDFSVTYQINGLLSDINKYFTISSLLNAKIIDFLHNADVEIVSPTFMNQRQVNEIKFISKANNPEHKAAKASAPEETMFDKAIEADKIEEKNKYLVKIEEEITELKDKIKNDHKNKEGITDKIKKLEDHKKRLKEHIEEQKNKLNEKE